MNEGPFKRVNFFEGQILTEKDLRNEQTYQNDKRRLINRCLYGSGVLCGLQVTFSNRTVLVGPGVALDCCGREIYIAEPTNVEEPPNDRSTYLIAQYHEYESEPVSGYGATTGTDQIVYSRITEGFNLSWSSVNPMARHAHLHDRWNSCGRDHPIPLAQLYQKRGRFVLDEEYALKVRAGVISRPFHLPDQ